MDLGEALRTLGVDDTAPAREVRTRYLALVREHHPDVAAGPTEGDVASINEAYRVVSAALASAHDAVGDGRDHGATAWREKVDVAAAGDTIVVELPPDEAFLAILDAAAAVGVVTYVDPEAGLLEIHLTLSDRSRCSLVCSLQGRAIGTTDVFCTLAWLDHVDVRGAPPVEAVVGELAAVVAGSLNC